MFHKKMLTYHFKMSYVFFLYLKKSYALIKWEDSLNKREEVC